MCIRATPSTRSPSRPIESNLLLLRHFLVSHPSLLLNFQLLSLPTEVCAESEVCADILRFGWWARACAYVLACHKINICKTASWPHCWLSCPPCGRMACDSNGTFRSEYCAWMLRNMGAIENYSVRLHFVPINICDTFQCRVWGGGAQHAQVTHVQSPSQHGHKDMKNLMNIAQTYRYNWTNNVGCMLSRWWP